MKIQKFSMESKFRNNDDIDNCTHAVVKRCKAKYVHATCSALPYISLRTTKSTIVKSSQNKPQESSSVSSQMSMVYPQKALELSAPILLTAIV